ncbi:MAG: reverse transcriptase domain-containing protein [Rhodocyclaceae bacterium]
MAMPFNFAALYRAWQACRCGKRGTRKAQRYETRLLDNLVDTAQALHTQAWRPSRPIRFVTLHPKPREILAAEFGDRVVHHLLVPWFERLFEPVFIHDSHANRKGHGTHAAVQRLQGFLRRDRSAHYLQLDIANFFNSIDRRTLYGLLAARVQRDLRHPVARMKRSAIGELPAQHDRPPGFRPAACIRATAATAQRCSPDEAQRNPGDLLDPVDARHMLWLARLLLTGNPAQGAQFQGRIADLARVPAHKQLINTPPEKGLPIGNLTSQFFANVYLNELDQFVKHRLKVRHYVRYVDDFVLVHRDPAQLARWCTAIEDFLRQRLGLALRDAGRLAPVADGIDFLGYVVRADYLLVRRRVVGHLHDRLTRFGHSIARKSGVLACPPEQVDRLQAMLASYFGHFRHARSQRLQDEVFRRHPWLGHWLAPLGDGRLRRVDRPASVSSLASQWRYFRKRYPGHALLMQVGNRWECAPSPRSPDEAQRTPGPSRVAGSAPRIPACGLHPCDGMAHVQRPGLPLTYPVSAADLPTLKRRLIRAGLPWCEVVEHGHLRGGMKCRQLRAVWPATPAPPPSSASTPTERRAPAGLVPTTEAQP